MQIRIMTLGLAAAALSLPALAHAAPAGRFLQDAVAGDNGEVALGRMAQERAADPRVKDFGRTLEQDHGMNRQQALDAARAARIRVAPDAMAPSAAQARRKLMGLRGPDFDRAFVRDMIADHRRDIAKFERQARSGDRVTARFARDTLPHLKHHLDLALSLDRRR